MTSTVFVSGATGYIAQHIIKILLAKGYHVIGSVRSAQKGEHLIKLFGSDKFTFEVVPDIGKEGAFDDALKKHPEVTVFLHTASPVSFSANDIEKELLNPAINGTKNALRAIKVHGQNVVKVVVTSSYASHWVYEKLNDPNYTITEESWNPITWEEAKKDGTQGYAGSKTFAEKAAWKFIAEEKPNFTITYVNPVFVFGPQAFDSEVKPELNFSSEIINTFLKLTPESPVPDVSGLFIDVRDVAKAHVAAFEIDLPNQRLLLKEDVYSGQHVLDIINENFKCLKGKLPIGEPGAGEKVTSKWSKVDNSKTKKLLGEKSIPLKKTIVDTIAQILKARENFE